MPYLTPDSGDLDTVSLYVLPAPASASGRAIVAGALAQLAREHNWQRHGTATPEETARAFLDKTAQTWRSHGPNTGYLARALTYSRATHYFHYPLSQSFACCVKSSRSLSVLAGTLTEYRDGAGDGLGGIYFDGSDTRLSFPMGSMAFDFPSNEGAFIVWARLATWEYAANLRWHRILHFSDYAGQVLELYRRGNTEGDYSLSRATANVTQTITATIQPGGPEYICFGADWSTSAGVMEFFINGSSVGTAPPGLGWRSAPIIGRIGGMASQHFFAGDIAHIGMWEAPIGAAGHSALGAI